MQVAPVRLRQLRELEVLEGQARLDGVGDLPAGLLLLVRGRHVATEAGGLPRLLDEPVRGLSEAVVRRQLLEERQVRVRHGGFRESEFPA